MDSVYKETKLNYKKGTNFTMKDKLQKITERYFLSFENKDIGALKKIFDKDVKLFDPIVKEVIGRDKVLEVNKNIFNTCKLINFTQKNIFIDSEKMVTIGEIEFYCDKVKLNVVDIIKFNSKFKIISITAYLDTEVLND